MKSDIAISVKNISKTFRIPHEKISSVRGAVVGAFRKKSYEEFKALDDVSFEVKKGEFFGIIGRNGSGKSTLLKILAGIYQPDKGKVHINGRISPFLELGIGFNPELSGRDNVYLNATVLGLTKKEIDEKFDSIVKFSELERFIDQKLKNYSSGMQVRLAFSVSIHANRDILLMDEVLAVGDSNFQAKCLEEFNKYREMGRTVIIVTHDISVVQRYCDRAMLLRNGGVVKIGESEDVCDEYIYQNMFDAEKILNESGRREAKDDVAVKKVEIVSVELLDADGRIKNNFCLGDDIRIDLAYKKNRQVDDLQVGLAIFNKNGECVLGYNTVYEDNFEMPNEKITLLMENTTLKGGVYAVKAGLFYGDGARLNYDFKHDAAIFSYLNRSMNVGIVDGKYKWQTIK